MIKKGDYKDLVEVLLGPVRKRPGMFLGTDKISEIPSFVSGYRTLLDMKEEKDRFFDDPGFYTWFSEKYNIESPTLTKPFLEMADGNERVALKIFFEYLEDYSKDTGLKTDSKKL